MRHRARAILFLVAAVVACGGGAGEETAADGRAETGTDPASTAGLQTVEMTVPSMSCPLCSRSIEGRLKEAGVRGIMIDLETKRVTATFDSSRASMAEVKAMVEGQGFPVTEARLVEPPPTPEEQ